MVLGAASRLLDETRDRVRRQYGASIGQPVENVPTPALLLDLPAARRNVHSGWNGGIEPTTQCLEPDSLARNRHRPAPPPDLQTI